MSYQESLNEVRIKTEEELKDLQKAIKNAVTIFEMKTGMQVQKINPVYPLSCSYDKSLGWDVEFRLKPSQKCGEGYEFLGDAH